MLHFFGLGGFEYTTQIKIMITEIAFMCLHKTTHLSVQTHSFFFAENYFKFDNLFIYFILFDFLIET